MALWIDPNPPPRRVFFRQISSQGKARHVGCCWTGSRTSTSSRYTWCLGWGRRYRGYRSIDVEFYVPSFYLGRFVKGDWIQLYFQVFVCGGGEMEIATFFWLDSSTLYLVKCIEEIDYRELGVGKATFARFFFCVAVRWAGVRQTRFCCQGPLMTFYLYRVDNDQRWGLLSRATGGRCWPPMTGTNSMAWTWPTSWVMCGNWSMTRNQGELHTIFAIHCWFAKHHFSR